jgi:Ca2+-binding RTX toxin-like protein
VSFADGIFGGFTIANGVVIENARGGDGDDTLIGDDADNLLVGGDGADVLRGGLGSDDLRGGDGIDSASYAGAGRGVTVDLSATGFQGTGGAGLDRLIDIEGLIGSSFADVLTGGAGANRLEGGAGVDTLTGGGGRDVFVFDEGDSGAIRATADRILDFSRRAGDKIDLTGIDAARGNTTPVVTDPVAGETSGGAPIDDAFTFIGSGAFTGVAGQLRAARNESTSIVSGDTDGDHVADFMIIVTSDQAMRATDFLFRRGRASGLGEVRRPALIINRSSGRAVKPI